MSNSACRNGGAHLFFTTFTLVLLPTISTPDFSSLSDLMIRFSDSVIFSSDNIEKDLKSSVKKHSKDSLSFKDSSSEEKLMDFLLKNIN